MTTTQKAVLLHPMGSMGEAAEPAIRLLGSDPGDRAHDAVAVYGYVKDGVVVVTEERRGVMVQVDGGPVTDARRSPRQGQLTVLRHNVAPQHHHPYSPTYRRSNAN